MAVKKKTACGCCGTVHQSFYDRKNRLIRDYSSGGRRVFLEVEIRRVQCRKCGTVKQEKIPWLSKRNPFYTGRFAWYVGRRCRKETIKDVSKELKLDWKTVKELEKEYMGEQLRRVGKVKPKVIGIDEISISKGHSYRIVVSDLERHKPICLGCIARSEASLDMFMLASERSIPPNQIGLCLSRSLTTMR